jgi:hypothetical protein
MNEDEMGGRCNTHGIDDAYKVLFGKPERKRRIGVPRLRWGNNITMNLREIGWKGVDWMHLARDRDQWRFLVNIQINLRVP